MVIICPVRSEDNMFCEICEEDMGNLGWAVIVVPEPLHFCDRCRVYVEKVLNGDMGVRSEEQFK